MYQHFVFKIFYSCVTVKIEHFSSLQIHYYELWKKKILNFFIGVTSNQKPNKQKKFPSRLVGKATGGI